MRWTVGAMLMMSSVAVAKSPSPACSNVVSVSEDWPEELSCAQVNPSCDGIELESLCDFDLAYQTTGLGFTHAGTIAVTDTGNPVHAAWLDLPVGDFVEGETYTISWWSLGAPKTVATFTFELDYEPAGGTGNGPCGCANTGASAWWMGAGLALFLRRRRA